MHFLDFASAHTRPDTKRIQKRTLIEYLPNIVYYQLTITCFGLGWVGVVCVCARARPSALLLSLSAISF